MSKIADHPGLSSTETAWEGFLPGEVIVQDVCKACDKGLLYSPARLCIPCRGTGMVVVRTERVPPASQGSGEGDR